VNRDNFTGNPKIAIAASWFISKPRKWVQRICVAWRAFKAVRRFLENFKNVKLVEKSN